MIQIQQERSPFAQDLCRCSRCGGLLSRYDFGFDEYGQTLENCSHCGPKILPRRVGAPLASVRNYKAPKPCGVCECGAVLKSATGGKPKRCRPCADAHQRSRSAEYHRELSARVRVAAPRRFTA